MKYQVAFSGRKLGAIGMNHPCTVVLEATSAEEARLKCYETHDHIHFPKVIEVAQDTPNQIKEGECWTP